MKQFQGSGSIHAITLVCRDSRDWAAHLRTAVSTTTDIDDRSDRRVDQHCNNYVTPWRHYGRLRQKARPKQEAFENVSSCSEAKAVQLSMDSRSGLTEFPLAPVETNDSKSYLAKVPSVTCMVVVQASSRGMLSYRCNWR